MSMSDKRKALLIGNNKYKHVSSLEGCENDVKKMVEVLEIHEREDPNFSVMDSTNLSNESIKKEIEILFQRESSYALFYFAGHGRVVDGEGYICGVDTEIKSNYGISMEWLNEQINNSKIPEITIILDCCHAGEFGNASNQVGEYATIRKGVTILAATTSNDEADEFAGKGIFTSILYEGLKGAAADILGHVTPVGLYNCAESILNPWQQRPVFKSYVDQMTPIRYCFPRVKKKLLRKINSDQFFKSKDDSIPLSSHTLTKGKYDPELKKMIALSAFERVGLLTCPDGQTLIEAILTNSCCQLSPYGKFFWDWVNKKGM